MSDTPRTDNCLTEILDAFGYVHQGNCPQRWVNHARELERELNAANDRIKRLEEAGDALYENSDPTRWDSLQAANRKLDQQEEWRKAKEDKP